MSDTPLAPSIEAACERWSGDPALAHRGHTLSYGELWERIVALAWAYRSLGIEPGDRVVCQLPTCPEYFIALGAAWACGAIHVGIHRDSTGAELDSLVARTRPAAVLLRPPADDADPPRAVTAVNAGVVAIVDGEPREAGQHALAELLEQPAPGSLPPAPAGAEDTALLLSTSGTTGRPKLVMETLSALWAKMQLFADAVSPGEDDVHLMYLPVNHVFGLKLALMALASGGRLVLLDRFSPAEALRLVEDERVTVLPGTPTHLNLLLRALEEGPRRVDGLRWAVSAAAPLAPEVIEGVYERLGAELFCVYGCSEGFLTVTSDRGEIRTGSAGRSVFRMPGGPDGTVSVLHTDRDVPLLQGEVGEIVYGSSRPVRYWGEPDAATGGRYRSGDLGWLDRDGRLFVSGRLKQVVNRGGLKVACGEVERGLARLPGVADCAVIPTPDPILGEAICACVVMSGGAVPDLASVRSHLSGMVARQKLPDELCVLDSIPRSPVGKIDRAALRARVVDGDLARERLRERAAAGA